MRTIALTCCFVLALTAPDVVRAQSRATLVPQVSFGTVYDDNLFALPVHNGDYMNVVTPGLEGSWDSPTLTLTSFYAFDMQRSIQNPALNTLEARRHAFFDSSWKTTPRLLLGFGTHYDRSETPGDLNPDTGILSERKRAYRWQLTPSIGYKLTPLTTITTNYSWTQEALRDDVSGAVHVGRITVARQLSERATLDVAYLGRMFVDRSGQQSSQAGLLGFTYTLAPYTTLTFQGGPRVTTYNGVQPEIVAAFMRKTDRLTTGFDAWHGETIILGIAGPVAVDSATGKFVWPVRHNFEIGTHIGYFDSTTLAHTRAQVYHSELVAAWSPGGPYTIAGSYGADVQRGDVRGGIYDGKTVLRNVFLLRVTVAPRLTRSFLPPDEEARAKGVIR